MIINKPNKEKTFSTLTPSACKKVRMRLAGGLAKKVRDWQIMGASVLQVRY